MSNWYTLAATSTLTCPACGGYVVVQGSAKEVRAVCEKRMDQKTGDILSLVAIGVDDYHPLLVRDTIDELVSDWKSYYMDWGGNVILTETMI